MHHDHNHTTSIRRRLTRGAALGAVLTGLLATSVSAATTDVEATEAKTFSPSAVATTAGNSVHWFGTPGGAEEHSVRQDAGIFDSGVPQSGLSYTRNFSAGTFPYHCEKHRDQGMVGQVAVAPQALTAPTGLPFTVRWATSASNTGTRFDVQYRIGTGTWRNWALNTQARSMVFGRNNVPVRLARGKTYSFRVVSRLGTSRSGLSPVKSFRVS
jgi:plastocyanin